MVDVSLTGTSIAWVVLGIVVSIYVVVNNESMPRGRQDQIITDVDLIDLIDLVDLIDLINCRTCTDP